MSQAEKLFIMDVMEKFYSFTQARKNIFSFRVFKDVLSPYYVHSKQDIMEMHRLMSCDSWVFSA